MMGASFHCVAKGVDSGEAILDVLNTRIDLQGTILELRGKDSNYCLFPALHQWQRIWPDWLWRSASARGSGIGLAHVLEGFEAWTS